MTTLVTFTFLALSFGVTALNGYKVHELNDRFLDFYPDSLWLVMFYVPWCGHCRKLEPVWMQVAQHLHESSVRVARVDCTKYSIVASHFNVHGFPTIKFLSGGDWQDTYSGDRQLFSIVNYARRLSQPTVGKLPNTAALRALFATPEPFFVFIGDAGVSDSDADVSGAGGESGGELWSMYRHWAAHFRAYHSFYHGSVSLMKEFISDVRESSVAVRREDSFVLFQQSDSDSAAVNRTMFDFVNKLRFDRFIKVTSGNISQLLQTDRMLAVAVLQEDLAGRIPPEQQKFRRQLRNIASQHLDMFPCVRWQFGWVSQTSVVGSITASDVPSPSLLVLNMTDLTYYLPAGDAALSTDQAIISFLQAVDARTVEARGGDTYWMRVYRAVFAARVSLAAMWKADAMLTVLLFGLPSGFLALICYSTLCHDMLESDESEQQPHTQPEAANHEKHE